MEVLGFEKIITDYSIITAGVTKKFLKSNNLCKVSFKFPKDAATHCTSVNLVGDFNAWDIYATPMKKDADGNFIVTIDLEKGREYQYRFLIDETRWENDWHADRYVPSPYGQVENSVVVV
ncbi:MAG: isoamylase early set domain-containing protein [Nitrospirae bacterium]|nr:isoamylase early set domain-containing protein [Nitrospirota bacterium]MBF0539869.1 isoamylase early set domain-containing protein [Nitrospirota bacterium]